MVRAARWLVWMTALAVHGAARAAAPCESVDEQIATFTAAVAAGDQTKATAALGAVEAALGCGPPPHALALAALYEHQAVFFTTQGAADEAALARDTAAALRGNGATTAPTTGSLRTAAAPGTHLTVWLNGAPAVDGAPLRPGVYAVVVRGGPSTTARFVVLWNDEDLRIGADGSVEVLSAATVGGDRAPAATGGPTDGRASAENGASAGDSLQPGSLQPDAAPADALALPSAPSPARGPASLPAPPSPRSPSAGRPWFLAAGGAALGAAATAVVARAQIPAAADATRQAEIDQARRVQLVTGMTSYTLMAATGAFIVVGVRR